MECVMMLSRQRTELLALPFTVEREHVPRRAAELRLAELVDDVYADPHAAVARAARRASCLITLHDRHSIVGFALVRIHQVLDLRAACLELVGSDALHRPSSVILTLLSVADHVMAPAGVELTWTTTAHPTMARMWQRHFAGRELDLGDPAHAALAAGLWETLGAQPSADPAICRAGFPGELTGTELALIVRTNRAFPGYCDALDASAGDRMVLVAPRTGSISPPTECEL